MPIEEHKRPDRLHRTRDSDIMKPREESSTLLACPVCKDSSTRLSECSNFTNRSEYKKRGKIME